MTSVSIFFVRQATYVKPLIWLIASFMLVSLSAPAQTADKDTTLESLKRRTDFAKMYIGIDGYQTTGGTTQYRTTNGLQSASFAGTISPRIVWGATHFWGHADIYIAIPVMNRQLSQTLPVGLRAASFVEGLETGIRVFPWAIEAGKLRPFVGVSFKGMAYAQFDQTLDRTYTSVPSAAKTIFPLQAGLSYARKHALFQLGVHYRSLKQLRYPVARTEMADVSLSPWSFNLGIAYWLNTNGIMATPDGVRRVKQGPKLLAARNLLNCWYVGIGPSASFEMSKSEYVKDNRPYLAQQSPGSFIADITAGRYFHKPDLNVGVSVRRSNATSSGYGSTLNYKRRSYMLEAYKFLGDYHGFVPYIGPTLAYENLTFTDTDGTLTQQFQAQKLAIGIIFGWDIRLRRSEYWLLRTNLRYTPNLHLKANGKKVMFDQMEFNFIQFVWLVGRRQALLRQ
jgi:outer membrane protein W